jgi:hypothetical protein
MLHENVAPLQFLRSFGKSDGDEQGQALGEGNIYGEGD